MDELYSETRLIDVYDVINASREDFDFYLRQLPPPPAVLLDIGCGTGTFACEMALRGYDVTAIDPAPAMIAAAQQKDSALLVKWRTGYVSDLPSEPCFDAAVMTGHAFQCLLTDQQITDLFQSVARRLTPGGTFHFESRNPAARAGSTGLLKPLRRLLIWATAAPFRLFIRCWKPRKGWSHLRSAITSAICQSLSALKARCAFRALIALRYWQPQQSSQSQAFVAIGTGTTSRQTVRR
ncbi:class I SAM-dependent methyltransferase [Shimia sp.]|uniref:class I SAM-dependent methyltransferase n=1 Tax=Shimia sp. TaxID=1954381 RepID=UPI003BAD4104